MIIRANSLVNEIIIASLGLGIDSDELDAAKRGKSGSVWSVRR